MIAWESVVQLTTKCSSESQNCTEPVSPVLNSDKTTADQLSICRRRSTFELEMDQMAEEILRT